MVVENLRRVADTPLSQVRFCAVCLEEVPHLEELKGKLSREELKHANYWTQDHVISKIACKQHRSIFGEIRNDGDNLIVACRHHHRRIDRGKQQAYYERNVAGLLLYIANEYPRSVDPSIAQIQQQQFHRLFENVLESVYDPAGGYTLSEYKLHIVEVIKDCLERLEGPPPSTPLIYRRKVDTLAPSNIRYLMFS